MTDEVKKRDAPDYMAIWNRYHADAFGKGAQAELRRVADPEDLLERPALYRLFPGERPTKQHLRLAFLLPYCKHQAGAENLRTSLVTAKKRVAEERVMQMARSSWPEDINYLRRILVQAEPSVDWQAFAESLWFWNDDRKRRIVEDYFIAQFNPAKGAKK